MARLASERLVSVQQLAALRLRHIHHAPALGAEGVRVGDGLQGRVQVPAVRRPASACALLPERPLLRELHRGEDALSGRAEG